MTKRIAIISVLLVCAGCASNGVNIPNIGVIPGTSSGSGAASLPQVLQHAKDALLGTAPLLPDKHVQRYENEVGRWLALQTERPDLPWRFAVLDDTGINAFAAPGGYIFITKGLLARMKNES